MIVYILYNTASRIKVRILNKYEFKKTAVDKILDININKPKSSKEPLVEVF